MSVTIRVLGDVAGEAVGEEGQTVLEAALAGGIAFPHDCQAGNCAACKCELLEGDVMMLEHSEYALTPEEADRKLILACRAQAWSDCTVRPLPSDETAVHPSRVMRCRVVGLDNLTHDIKRVRLSIEAGGPYTFSAGQYAKVRFAPLLPERSYSMANRPDDGEPLEFHVRKVPGGQATAFLFDKLALGDEVRVSGPHGAAFLRSKHEGPLLAIGGGSGFAPLWSIMKTALASDPRRPVKLYWGVRAERDVYAIEELRALCARHPNVVVNHVLSEPASPGSNGFRSGLVGDALRADGISPADGKAYVAGPPPMVEHVQRVLTGLGWETRHVHTDPFYSQAELTQS